MRFVLASLLVLTACQPSTPKPDESGQDEPGAPMEPAPDPTPVVFPALSDNAKEVTGAVSLSAQPRAGPNAPPAMKLTTETGLVFESELMPGAAEQATVLDWTKIFGAEVVVAANPPPGAPSVQMHDIVSETVPNTAPKGGFCGAEATAFIAMATGLEAAGQQRMAIAAFKGDQWPPENPSTLCGVFTYTPPAMR